MKNSMKLAVSEKQFTEIVWKSGPLSSGELARLAEQKLGWKRTTSYTVLKRLQERGVLANENGIVRALVSEAEYQTQIGEDFLEESFGGSLPAFVAAFTTRQKLSPRDVEELHKLIQSYEGGGAS